MFTLPSEWRHYFLWPLGAISRSMYLHIYSRELEMGAPHYNVWERYDKSSKWSSRSPLNINFDQWGKVGYTTAWRKWGHISEIRNENNTKTTLLNLHNQLAYKLHGHHILLLDRRRQLANRASVMLSTLLLYQRSNQVLFILHCLYFFANIQSSVNVWSGILSHLCMFSVNVLCQ